MLDVFVALQLLSGSIGGALRVFGVASSLLELQLHFQNSCLVRQYRATTARQHQHIKMIRNGVDIATEWQGSTKRAHASDRGRKRER